MTAGTRRSRAHKANPRVRRRGEPGAGSGIGSVFGGARRTSGLTQQQAADLIAAYGRALTKRQREVLATMAKYPDDEEGELVYERGIAFLHDERVAARTVNALIRACAIRNDGDEGGIERYHINDTGREILRAASAASRAPSAPPNT